MLLCLVGNYLPVRHTNGRILVQGLDILRAKTGEFDWACRKDLVVVVQVDVKVFLGSAICLTFRSISDPVARVGLGPDDRMLVV